jgi:SAM-dependent methyltransferase
MFDLKKIDFFHFRLILAVAILSSAIVSYEIQLMHFFTIVQWHNFAYMMISIALLGFGASGTVISIFRKGLLKRKDHLLPFFMISSGLFMTLAVRLSRTEFFIFDSYTLFVDQSQFLRLFGIYFLFFLPFFSGAMAIGMIFVKKIKHIGTYYLSDLFGAGIGGIVVILLFWKFTPQEIPSIIAILPILAGLIILRVKYRILLLSFAVFSLTLALYHIKKPFNLSYSQFKSLSYTLNLPQAKIDQEINSPYGLIQVVSSPVLRYAPGLSLTYSETVPSSPIIFNNGDWYASIYPWSKKDTSHLLNYTTMALPYSLGQLDSILILNAKGGFEISHALVNGAKLVTGIEPNKIVVALLNNEYASFTDSLLYQENVQINVLESRTFISQTSRKYDMIQLPMQGSFGGSLGLNAMTEENLFTKKAFTEIWKKLKPDGMIVVSSWTDYPYKIALKNATTISAFLESFELENYLDHIAMIRSWGTITFVVKRSPLNETDIMNIRSFCNKLNFDPIVLPGIVQEERVQYNAMEDNDFFSHIDDIFSSQRNKVIDEYDFKIQPATDNKPYFFQFLRWKKLPGIINKTGLKSTAFLELGYMIVVITFIQVIILALVLIVLPLFRLGLKGGNKSWVMLYFLALGMGYMFLEIVFIKYFVLYLGHPIYSVATVISVMLISSGLGSYFSSKFRANRNTLLKLTALIAGFILIYTFFIGSFLSSTLGLNMIMKLVFTGILIALPSFLMGMPFPIGLKIVDQIKKSNVPWAWGINGCVSVISTSLAAIIAVELGFMILMFLASMAYGIAFLSNYLLDN